MSDAVSYRLSFLPADPNIAPEECMPIHYYATPQKALVAAMMDAQAHHDSHASAGEHDEARAYAATWRSIYYGINPHAIDGTHYITRGVDVVTGDNCRRIGTYYVHPVREGDQADCSLCGDFRGIVTAIHANGDTFATCEDCDREERSRIACDAIAEHCADVKRHAAREAHYAQACPTCGASGLDALCEAGENTACSFPAFVYPA